MSLRNYSLLCLLISAINFFNCNSQTWTDISTPWITTQKWPQSGGPNDGNWNCSGVLVNRLTGDIVVNFSTYGLWRSSDQGKTFARIDGNTVSGVNSFNGGLQCDQDDPKRMAEFSLDGFAAYTSDGIHWNKMTQVGRNWDLGAVDWSSPNPKVFIGAHHESSGELDLSTDGGVTWTPMSIKVDFQFSGTTARMIGIIDSTTFIYSNSNGINRSTDRGKTWTNVSAAVTRTKIATMFKGVCYVGTTTGLMVSMDKGATWQSQGASIDIVQGPQFGADEKTMVIVNTGGMYKSTDAGTTWNLISALTKGLGSGIPSGPGRFSMTDVTYLARYQWDPVHNSCYASALTSPVYKKYLGAIDTISPSAPTNITATNITSAECTVSWTAATDNTGVVLYEIFKSGASPIGTSATTSFNVTGLSPSTSYTIQVKAVDGAGNISSSGSVTFTTAKDTIPPSAPGNVTASNITTSGCNILWTASTDNVGVVSYEIFKSGVSIGTTAATSFTITGLSLLTSYTFMIKAKDAAGNYSLGGSVNVTPVDKISPSPPTKITVTDVFSSECTVSWTAATDNIGVALYEIFLAGDSIGTTETTSFKVTGLSPSASYQILVRAKDAAGNSSSKSGILVSTKGAGLSMESHPEILIYPNPASDHVMIEIPESISGFVIIYNASGEIVAEKVIQLNNIMIDVSAFPKGFYLAKIASGNEFMNRPFLVQ